MDHTERDESEAPDESTSLLPQDNTALGASEHQIAPVNVERNASAGNDFESQEPPATAHTELDINRSDRSWTGIPSWLGWIAILALLLGFVADVNRDTKWC
jgi:hypothetical protein